MSTDKIVGILTAALALVGLMTMLNSGTSTPLAAWPFETLQGIAFSIGWLSGVPAVLAYLLAVIVIALVAFIGYKVGQLVWRGLSRLGG